MRTFYCTSVNNANGLSDLRAFVNYSIRVRECLGERGFFYLFFVFPIYLDKPVGIVVLPAGKDFKNAYCFTLKKKKKRLID